LSRLEPGRTVAVIGGGSIGLSVLLASLAAGAEGVVVCEPQAGKRELAGLLGATSVLDPAEDGIHDRIGAALGGRPDVVVDCVASPATIADGVRLASRGGTVVVVGVGHGQVQVPIESIQDDEVAIIGSAMYLADDFDRAEELVAAGAPVASLITAVLPLADAVEGLRRAASGLEVKVHLAGPAAPDRPATPG
jgi:threonine dehydrogenase-like Zn-dependent dehydrogenase